ncbi:hypothetical protein F4561_005868 [Lipingzhangella halophila]|uniref:Uncharacterized protein n=1 Tax=Lipingzhangella halophila TaxID=1783352 RepID=A0A7W7RN03_9ACTN|nr:hypothetical protein [Lipingzhangella halophila]MBB4934974.1 hypothetical protein [Lipingzhangella halophila]
MASRKKSGRPRGSGRGKHDIPRTPTRDPGPTGNVGCWVVVIALACIALVVVLLEVFG